MSNSKTRPTRPRIVSLTGAKFRVGPPMCRIGRAKEIIAAVNSSVTTIAHSHSHQSRRSTCRTQLRRSGAAANAVVTGRWGLAVFTHTQDNKDLLTTPAQTAARRARFPLTTPATFASQAETLRPPPDDGLPAAPVVEFELELEADAPNRFSTICSLPLACRLKLICCGAEPWFPMLSETCSPLA